MRYVPLILTLAVLYPCLSQINPMPVLKATFYASVVLSPWVGIFYLVRSVLS